MFRSAKSSFKDFISKPRLKSSKSMLEVSGNRMYSSNDTLANDMKAVYQKKPLMSQFLRHKLISYTKQNILIE